MPGQQAVAEYKPSLLSAERQGTGGRALASHHAMWPRPNLKVNAILDPGNFSGFVPIFLLPQKLTFLNSNSIGTKVEKDLFL